MPSSLARRTFLLAAPSTVALTLLSPRAARARVQTDFTYSWSQVWQAAVRMVRVDLQCPITDRDEEIGYVMFDYTEAGRAHAGSIELVRTTGTDGADRIRAVVQVASLPSWVERMLLDRLTRKLREDFGEPPRPARVARPDRSPAERPGTSDEPSREPPSDS